MVVFKRLIFISIFSKIVITRSMTKTCFPDTDTSEDFRIGCSFFQSFTTICFMLYLFLMICCCIFQYSIVDHSLHSKGPNFSFKFINQTVLSHFQAWKFYIKVPHILWKKNNVSTYTHDKFPWPSGNILRGY